MKQRDRFEELIELSKKSKNAIRGSWSDAALASEFEQSMGEVVTIILQAEKALKECDDVMSYMSEYDIPLCMPDHVKRALSAIDSFRKGEEK